MSIDFRRRLSNHVGPYLHQFLQHFVRHLAHYLALAACLALVTWMGIPASGIG